MNSQAPYRWVSDPRNISKGSSTRLDTSYQQELSSTTITDPQRRSLRSRLEALLPWTTASDEPNSVRHLTGRTGANWCL
jgi:hypothetical protein